MIHKVIRKLVNLYRIKEEKRYLQLLGKTGKEDRIEYPAIIGNGERISLSDNGVISAYSRMQTFPNMCEDSEIIIGNNFFSAYRLSLMAGEKIIIGNDVLVASDVTIVSYNHGMNPEDELPYKDQKLNCKPIKIGNNVWIGEKTMIFSGVTIGDNVIIGAGSNVTTDISSNCMAVGNPARVIKKYDNEAHKWIRI